MIRLSFIPYFIIFLLILNCYSTEKKYSYGQSLPDDPKEEEIQMFDPEESQFEEGVPNSVIDFIGNVFGFLGKIVLFDGRMMNHRISQHTKKYLQDYIVDNNLKDVKVRFNQYAPLSEWKRLVRNKKVNWSLRYSLGVVYWLLYTILPDRLFGTSDYYNPFTNTIHVFSDLVPVVVHEGGHAKDFELKYRKNLYTLVRLLPLAALYQEGRASDDAIRYFRSRCDKPTELEGYKILYPAFSTYSTGSIPIIGYGLGLAAAVPGHIWGGRKAKGVIRETDFQECTPQKTDSSIQVINKNP